MTTITVNIPDKEVSFFLKLLQKFQLDPVITENEEISKKVQAEILHRKKTAKAKDYISAEESISTLKKKHGL